MSRIERLQQRIKELQTHFELLSQKIPELRKAHGIETDPAIKLKLVIQIEETEKERAKTEGQLELLEIITVSSESNTQQSNWYKIVIVLCLFFFLTWVGYVLYQKLLSTQNSPNPQIAATSQTQKLSNSNDLSFTAKLNRVEYYDQGVSNCSRGFILVRELFEIKDIAPADLIFVDVSPVNECTPYMFPIMTVSSEGYIVRDFCAPPNWGVVPTKIRFLRFRTGEISNTIDYTFDIKSAQKIKTMPPKLTYIK
jgi:hypothetical protein